MSGLQLQQSTVNKNLIDQDSAQHKNALKGLIKDLQKDEANCFPFLEPVQWQALGLLDYPQVVKRPMDVNTVKKNIEKGKYQYFEEVFTDLNQIWLNCKLYNQSGSEIYRLAENMERRCKKLIKELRTALKLESSVSANPSELKQDNEDEVVPQKHASEGVSSKGKESKDEDDDDFGFDPERYVPFDEKVEFSDLIKRVSKEGLTQIVNFLKEKQPEALEDLGNDRLQIKIDMIEREAFNHCKEILNINAKEAPNKRQKTSVNQSAPLLVK